MTKSVFYILYSFVIFSANCFGQAVAEIEPKAELKIAKSPLEGAWQVVEAWEGTEKEEELEIWLEFEGDKIIAHSDGDIEISSYKIDPKKKQVVITSDTESVKGIYKIEKDIMTLTFYLEGRGFPKTFAPEEDKAVMRLKLKKPIDKKFIGNWICIEGWESGEKNDDEDMVELVFRIKGYLFEVFDGELEQDIDGGDVEADDTFVLTIDEKLKRIQLDDQMGDKYNCIYKFEKDVLTLHFYDNTDAEGKNADFPKDYKITPDSILMMLKKSVIKEAK